jgi:hypothetical protein
MLYGASKHSFPRAKYFLRILSEILTRALETFASPLLGFKGYLPNDQPGRGVHMSLVCRHNTIDFEAYR